MTDTPSTDEATSPDTGTFFSDPNGLSALLDDLYDIGDKQDAVDEDLDRVSQALEPVYPTNIEATPGARPVDLLSSYPNQPPEVQEVILALARIPVRHQDNEDRLVAEATASARVDRERREAAVKEDSRRTDIVLVFVILVWMASFAASVYFFAVQNPVAGLVFLGGPMLLFLGNVIAKVLTRNAAQEQ